jgi:hypothetical protein
MPTATTPTPWPQATMDRATATSTSCGQIERGRGPVNDDRATSASGGPAGGPIRQVRASPLGAVDGDGDLVASNRLLRSETYTAFPGPDQRRHGQLSLAQVLGPVGTCYDIRLGDFDADRRPGCRAWGARRQHRRSMDQRRPRLFEPRGQGFGSRKTAPALECSRRSGEDGAMDIAWLREKRFPSVLDQQPRRR